MTKYNLTFHVKVWADDPSHAYRQAVEQVGKLPTPPEQVFAVLPTGGATGAPMLSGAEPGWMVVFSIDEAD